MGNEEFKRLNAWIHWKKIQLEKYPDEDEQFMLNDLIHLKQELDSYRIRTKELEEQTASTQKKLLEANKKIQIYKVMWKAEFEKGQEDKNNYEKLRDYIEHSNKCIKSYFEEGEPIKDGGYRIKYKGKWYRTKPIDESPKCDCGLDEVLKGIENLKKYEIPEENKKK